MAVTPCDGLTVTLQHDPAVTSNQTVSTPWRADRHTLWRPSRVRENQSPPRSEAVFPSFPPTLSTCSARPEHVQEDAWPINRSKEERKRVGKVLGSIRYFCKQKHIFLCNLYFVVSILIQNLSPRTFITCNFELRTIAILLPLLPWLTKAWLIQFSRFLFTWFLFIYLVFLFLCFDYNA